MPLVLMVETEMGAIGGGKEGGQVKKKHYLFYLFIYLTFI